MILLLGLCRLSDVNICSTHREKIQLHEVALRFLEGDEARGAEPAAASGDGRRREHPLGTRTAQTKGGDTLFSPHLS